MSNIVLISNGPLALEREAGKTIDSFDEVVRFNNYEVKGYEKYVGEKTDIWSTRICATIFRKNPAHFKKIYGVINHCKYTKAIYDLVPDWEKMYPAMHLIHSDEVAEYAKLFDYDPQHNWLSVGMITIFHLLNNGYDQVHLYAFGGDTSIHYFPRKPRDPKFHQFDAEREYLSKLEKEGKVVRI